MEIKNKKIIFFSKSSMYVCKNYNNMSKTIEVYLWLNEPDKIVLDMVVDGETVHTRDYYHEIIAYEHVSQLLTPLGLNEVEKLPTHIKYSNQCEKK